MDLRLKKIYSRLEKDNFDALLVFSQPNISYLINYPSRDSYLFVSKKRTLFLTDSRYSQEAGRAIKSRIVKIKKMNAALCKHLALTCKQLGIRRLGFEAKYVSYAQYQTIKDSLPKGVMLVPAYDLIESHRQIKTDAEIKNIEKAVDIAIQAFSFIKNHILPGKTELEIAGELLRFITLSGARGCAFEIIVASGPNASFPHHLTSQRRIRQDEAVLIDMGVDYEGYKSDLTRVFFSGKIHPHVKRIYDIVLQAQQRAFDKIQPGRVISEIDFAARQYIKQRGYGGFFGHNVGHGIGLQVHEYPHISCRVQTRLARGMVFTIEPGIYVPGRFGIRLEDIVQVTNRGYRLLSGELER